MSATILADCVGLWRRTLLIEPDGSHDVGTDVLWLQGHTAYVDSRGFAGTLRQRGDTFQWHRTFDLLPPTPFPDAGVMHWDGATLVETGVHEDYVEHWVREQAPTQPRGALFLSDPLGGAGLLVRAGAHFGWACANEVYIDDVGAPRWAALGIDLASRQVHANGLRWSIQRSEGAVEL
jgi:hypothetical protein